MALEEIAAYLVIALIGLSLLTIFVFGIRSISYGKVEPTKMVFMALPFVLFGILGFILPSWTEAGMYTLLTLIGLAIVAMLLSSVKGVFR